MRLWKLLSIIVSHAALRTLLGIGRHPSAMRPGWGRTPGVIARPADVCGLLPSAGPDGVLGGPLLLACPLISPLHHQLIYRSIILGCHQLLLLGDETLDRVSTARDQVCGQHPAVDLVALAHSAAHSRSLAALACPPARPPTRPLQVRDHKGLPTIHYLLRTTRTYLIPRGYGKLRTTKCTQLRRYQVTSCSYGV